MPGSQRERREYGSGSQFQRADGRWVVSAVNPNGGRFYGTGKSLKEAKARLRERSRSLTSPETVADLVDRWLDDRKSRVRARTLEQYTGSSKHVLSRIGELPAHSLTADDVRRMVDEMMTSYAPQTAGHALKALRAALGMAYNDGKLERNVAAGVRAPRVPRHDHTVLSAAQVAHFLDVNRGDPLYALWTLAATTGMRRGELLGLEWANVDLDRAELHVRLVLRPIRGRLFAWEAPKTPRSNRTLNLSRIAVEALRRHPRGLGSVFAREDGGPLHHRSVTRAFHRATDRAGLPRVRLHDLRHGVAQMLLDASGGDLRIAMAQLGHANLSTTVDLYGGLADEARRKAGETMDRLVPAREVG